MKTHHDRTSAKIHTRGCSLRNELETICLKCLDTDPGRRDHDAQKTAEDPGALGAE